MWWLLFMTSVIKSACDHLVIMRCFSNQHDPDQLNKPMQHFPLVFGLEACTDLMVICYCCHCRPSPPMALSPSWRRGHVQGNPVLSLRLQQEAPPNSKSASVKKMPYWTLVRVFWVGLYTRRDTSYHVIFVLYCIIMYRWSGWRLLFVLSCPLPGNGGRQHGRDHDVLLPGWSLFKYLHRFLTQHGLLLWIRLPNSGHSHMLVHSCIIVALLHWLHTPVFPSSDLLSLTNRRNNGYLFTW